MKHATAINFFFEDIEAIKPPEKFDLWVKDIAKTTQKQLEVNYVFCSDNHILEINKTYLNHDYFTDIITFDLSNENTPDKITSDIFISLDTVKSNAQKFDVTFEQELSRVMAHGILHLIGFNDKTSAEKERMRKEENKAIAFIQN